MVEQASLSPMVGFLNSKERDSYEKRLREDYGSSFVLDRKILEIPVFNDIDFVTARVNQVWIKYSSAIQLEIFQNEDKTGTILIGRRVLEIDVEEYKEQRNDLLDEISRLFQ